jgi:hypothetical protein
MNDNRDSPDDHDRDDSGDGGAFRRFLCRTSAVVVLGALLAVALIVVADPYRIYQLIDLPGFNHVKPQPDHFQQEIKLTLARKAKANVIVLGNSRAEYGLNPLHLLEAGAADNADKPFNLAMSGTDIAAARAELAYLEHIGQRPKRIVLGVDFPDFLVDPSKAQVRRAHAFVYKPEAVKWQFDAMFSLASLSDVWRTLTIQHRPEAESMTPEGLNPLHEYNKYARDEGYFAIFQQRALEYAHTFVLKPHGLHYADGANSSDMDDLRAMIALSLKNKTELQLVIYPYHAQMLAMFEEAGLWPAFEEWKGMLAEEVAAARRQDPQARISLWDFSGFSAMPCEPIPVMNDTKTVTRWYWESGHFKLNVGDLMLARLNGESEKEKETGASQSFGYNLSPANLLENQARIARERAACIAARPELFEHVKGLIRHAQNARAKLP